MKAAAKMEWDDSNPLDVVFGRDMDIVPDGTVLYLADLRGDSVGDILVEALHASPVSIIADQAPLANGHLSTGDGSIKGSFIQFDGVRLISEAEMQIIVITEG